VKTANVIREIFSHHWKRTLAAVVGLALVLLVVRSPELHAAVTAVFAAARGVMVNQALGGMLLFVLLSALSAMVAFFSSAVLVPIGIYAWGTATTCLLLWLGWLLGGAAAYAAGRYLGRRVIVWLINEERLRHYEQRVSAHAPFKVILLFQLALPSEVPGYVVGVLRYSFPRYLAALALAELPFAAGAVFLGESFIRADYRAIIGVGIALIAVSIVAVTAWQRVNGRHPRR
jgi:uncharacterized membrane protein YdjX (TVP38/TMEM64 family)